MVEDVVVVEVWRTEGSVRGTATKLGMRAEKIRAILRRLGLVDQDMKAS